MDFVSLVFLLVIDTSASWIRMFAALGISVVISVVVGIYAATHPKAEKIILPIVDVLQTIPILAFFPVVIVIFVYYLPGYIGINAAVISLIVTSMLWNIILGVYEAVKTMPKEFLEVSELYHFNRFERLRKMYLPACFPRIVEQSILSWSIGLFYLVTSEIFSTGTANYQVTYGFGTALIWLVSQGAGAYLTGIAVFVIFVIATRFLFFMPLEKYSVKYMKQQTTAPEQGYERIIVNWIVKKIPKTPAIFESTFAGTGPGPLRRIVYAPAAAPSFITKKKFYIPILGAIALIALFLLVSNPVYLGYEMQVLPALAESFARVWFAFAAILVVAIPVCVYIVFVSKQSSKYMLLFQIIASVPATILLPAIAIGFSRYPHSGELVAFVIFFLSGIWYVIFSIVGSTKTLPQTVFEVQKVFGVKGSNAWKNVYWKAIIPGLITGAMTGIAAEWNASIVAEYFTSTGVTGNGGVITAVGTGIGKLLDIAVGGGTAGLDLMMVALLNLVVMILIINTFLWKRFYNNVSKVYGG